MPLQAKKAGKNYSKNNTSGKRSPKDFYQTPGTMTDALLALPELRTPRLPILEPACGECAIVNVLRGSLGENVVVYYDLAVHGNSFLDEGCTFPTIITNPPFSLSLEFIQKCKTVATHTFALLMDLEYLHGAERFREVYSIMDHWPLVSVNVFTRRPMLGPAIREDGLYKTGMTTYAWYIWQRHPFIRRSRPVIRWIDNDAHVLRTGRKRD